MQSSSLDVKNYKAISANSNNKNIQVSRKVEAKKKSYFKA